MSEKFPLEILLSLAQKKVDDASVQLGKLQQEWIKTSRTLDKLYDYRREYEVELYLRYQAGISGGTL